jgi:hypothetical protein
MNVPENARLTARSRAERVLYEDRSRKAPSAVFGVDPKTADKSRLAFATADDRELDVRDEEGQPPGAEVALQSFALLRYD